MSAFYKRYLALCKEKNVAPQNRELLDFLGVSSGTVTQWKNRDSIPKGETLCKMSQYFDVSVDYILGLTDVRKVEVEELSIEEKAILDTYRSCSGEDRLRIAQYCMNIKDEKGMQENVG